MTEKGQQFHSFDVKTVDKDALKSGLRPDDVPHRRVVVSAEYGEEGASLVAAQIAAATHDEMPIEVRHRI